MTPLSILKDSLSADHKEFYIQLQYFLLQLAKLKNQRDDAHLVYTLKELIKYIKEILETHFRQEEESFFNQLVEIKPELEELITRLLEDHKAIRIKLTALEISFVKFQGAYELGVSEGSDYKQNLLFPAYNLIATINHHAEREDREIFKDFC
ncbi:MAG: Hemerythrin cation binding domain [Cyanobacteriota bacterium]|jgi:hemerythrin-like domain-containing protein